MCGSLLRTRVRRAQLAQYNGYGSYLNGKIISNGGWDPNKDDIEKAGYFPSYSDALLENWYSFTVNAKSTPFPSGNCSEPKPIRDVLVSLTRWDRGGHILISKNKRGWNNCLLSGLLQKTR